MDHRRIGQLRRDPVFNALEEEIVNAKTSDKFEYIQMNAN